MIVDKLGEKRFLREYWQRRPVLLKQALPGFIDPLSPEELAGLACEAEVESRLVFTKGRHYELKCSPFKVRDFTSLPARNWTLLVQAVDQWVPGVRALLGTVPFLPSWRVDDVMISYATPGGGVGPHFDHYDVFLVQGLGTRVWKTGQRCSDADSLRTDSGLKLLKRFDTEHEYRLEPGDVLYVPPGVAHWGISDSNSLCYSIGFRAPSLAELVQGYGEEIANELDAALRYTDPQRKLPLRAGEISATDLAQARQQLQAILHDDAALARWFGRHMTQPRYPDLLQTTDAKPRANTQVCLHPASRLAWQQQGKSLMIFCDGEQDVLGASAALIQTLQTLSRGDAVSLTALRKSVACKSWSTQLLQRGSLIPAGHD